MKDLSRRSHSLKIKNEIQEVGERLRRMLISNSFYRVTLDSKPHYSFLKQESSFIKLKQSKLHLFPQVHQIFKKLNCIFFIA